MPPSQPRLTAVVEKPLYEVVENLAKRDHMSLSQKVRDLLLGALELIEDASLEALVEERRKVSKKGYSLAETKRRFRVA
ncbi:MAG: toxin-antitoxin system, antitoxin component [Candidatus Omnitrophica bacterium]|nr:toxin-antitoxin system, antitoxin component [Candidatus Omnitrophota bacterium]